LTGEFTRVEIGHTAIGSYDVRAPNRPMLKALATSVAQRQRDHCSLAERIILIIVNGQRRHCLPA
jgi:hypothetical protein